MITARVNGQQEFKIEQKKDGLYANGVAIDWDVVQVDRQRFHILHQHKSYTLDVVSADPSTKTFCMKINNRTYQVVLKDRFDELLQKLGMDTAALGKVLDIRAPMPGLVVEVKVENGQSIKKGDAVVVLEAMKMENILKATADAIVKTVCVKKGSKVEKNEVLVVLQ